ncbi:SNAP25 homologous protein SNAP33-like [Juglans microcarpa x Juglans regia]|uniref:SNAP25 homologous protein SNAP33-like n=1 Tax=Juglans microcarpa x Juglans regia TaxID=2249226 RepID=UPI001B7DC870|nr:SNAP25 homologous protein SNAP33-like [Juglans microcarpa x Juglans regia]
MSGSNKSPVKIAEHNSVDPNYVVHSSSNPIDHVDELEDKQKQNSSRRSSSDPSLMTPNFGANPSDDDSWKTTSSLGAFSRLCSSSSIDVINASRLTALLSLAEGKYMNYAAYMTEGNTESVNRSLKIAEEKTEDATKTLVTLHHQGEQITRTPMVATDIDQNLGVICDIISESNTNMR